jgi:SNF2 family DNA or RNA helicase
MYLACLPTLLMYRWNKLVQKPFEDGDVRGLKLLQAILRPLMLRRTKESCDKDGRPILVLPSADMQVVECELTEAEQDFYQALYKKSKVKFDKFVEQGKVLHNYASILELLLRLRQCCDHPFLVLRFIQPFLTWSTLDRVSEACLIELVVLYADIVRIHILAGFQ